MGGGQKAEVASLIRDNQKNFSRLHVVVDACVITLSYFFAWALTIYRPLCGNCSACQKL